MAGFDEGAYNNYFGITPKITDRSVAELIKPVEDKEYTYNQFIPKQKASTYTTEDIPQSNRDRYVAENNIDDIDQLGDLLRRILNAAWGSDWGTISPELTKGESSDDVTLPQISFDINSREVSQNTPIKPKLTDTIDEVVNGKKTGDTFNIYRQWFDCVVEFNFWGRNTLEARQIMNKFEGLIGVYAGYLKRQGISEIFFLKEIPPTLSTKYVSGIPMRSLMYYIKLERIHCVRLSLLKKIDVEMKETNNLHTAEHINSSDDIFHNNNITYELNS